MSNSEIARTQLGSYSYDSAARLLRRNGDEIVLSRRMADLLALLAANVNSLVSRETILAQIWPEGFVHEGNLTQTIYLLRKSLAADPAVAIENVPRRGYRLRVRERAQDTHGRRRSTAFFAAASALILVLFVAAGIWMSPRSNAARPLPLNAREDEQLAMYHFERFADLGLARSHFVRITKEAPDAPEGYAGLALIHAIEGFDAPDRDRHCAEGRSAVAHANALETSALAHVASGMLHVTCDRSLTRARQELDAALSMNSSDTMALTLRARVAFWRNRPHEAIAFATEAVASDPTSPEALLSLGLAYYYAGELHNAADTFKRLLELMPNRVAALMFLEQSYEALGDFARADAVLRSVQHQPSNASWAWPARARLLALEGNRAGARAVLRRFDGISDPESLAAAYAAMGDDRAAIEKLRVAASRYSLRTQLSWLSDVRFASLRHSFPALTSTLVTWR